MKGLKIQWYIAPVFFYWLQLPAVISKVFYYFRQLQHVYCVAQDEGTGNFSAGVFITAAHRDIQGFNILEG